MNKAASKLGSCLSATSVELLSPMTTGLVRSGMTVAVMIASTHTSESTERNGGVAPLAKPSINEISSVAGNALWGNALQMVRSFWWKRLASDHAQRTCDARCAKRRGHDSSTTIGMMTTFREACGSVRDATTPHMLSRTDLGISTCRPRPGSTFTTSGIVTK